VALQVRNFRHPLAKTLGVRIRKRSLCHPRESLAPRARALVGQLACLGLQHRLRRLKAIGEHAEGLSRLGERRLQLRSALDERGEFRTRSRGTGCVRVGELFLLEQRSVH